ncbi:spore germination protein [Paenibacillus qinlingensis]|uniref:Spore germination protein KA n=1 Tax=Paenibacillus qinlingensis TaxID=1837343 RepID=A0ABU1NRW7_9BACL|nr:spore germination protein [Paenibacillus qinlingensis]MDR6550218.1 spore germination protein KA [Paenibacillus qinlingensis]
MSPPSISTNAIITHMINALGHSPDFKQHLLPVIGNEGVKCFYLESLVDKTRFEEFILQPIIKLEYGSNLEQLTSVLTNKMPSSFLQSVGNQETGLKYVLDGFILFVPLDEGKPFALDFSRIPARSVTEPVNEVTIRGPKEGFTEDMNVNLALVRKRLKSSHLTYSKLTIGQETHTDVYIVYLQNLASPTIIAEAKRRLETIQTDSILESSYIEECIQDTAWTPFQQVYATERPDVVTAHLLEGSFCIITAGTPCVLIGPITFFQLFNSPEDYYERADIATLIRWLRMFSFLLAIFVPSVYIALVTFHQEVLPSSLLISLSSQREGIPFPAFLEAMIMLCTFEILREAGLRMPRITGQAISIVGALVLGQSAVEAGLVSASMVIVVSITAIANFVTPSYSFGIAQRIIQFSFIILAGIVGMFGVTCGVLVLLTHLVSIRSFGVKYFTPLAPMHLAAFKDTLIRVPRPKMKRNHRSVSKRQP